jgi:hypothetical protein
MSDASISVAAFAEQVVLRPLWGHQVPAVESDSFIVAIAGGRRSGKTLAAQVKALYVAATNRDARVLVVSPAIENSRNFLRDLTDLIAGSKLSGSLVDEQTQLVTLSNGSEIRCVAATEGQVRGRGRNLRLVIVDEAAFVPSSIWRALFYTLFDERGSGSQAYLLCSPWGKNFFRDAFERGMAGDEDYAAFQWSMRENPTISAAFIERERERIAPSEAAAEIDGHWLDAQGNLFAPSLLESVTADIEIPALASLHGPARGIIGCDWGVSYDHSAAVGIYRLPSAHLNEPGPPVFVALPFSWPVSTPLHEVVDAVVPVADNFLYVASETNGVGSMPTQELFRRARREFATTKFIWGPINTTAASKTIGYATLLGLIERGRLVLPRHPGLLRQMAGLRFEQGERGFTRIEADDTAANDDLCDALMLASLPYRPSGAHRLVCALASLADTRRAIPDARVPDLECHVVETGAGLRVHSRPSLQGVASNALSLYSQPASPKPNGVQAGRFFIKTNRKVQ